jgi:hypothetical protein
MLEDQLLLDHPVPHMLEDQLLLDHPVPHMLEDQLLLDHPVPHMLEDQLLLDRTSFLPFPHPQAGVETYLLDTQYRMHPDLVSFSSRHFYDNKLLTVYEDGADLWGSWGDQDHDLYDSKGEG